MRDHDPEAFVTPAELRARRADAAAPLVVDVRTSEEYAAGHVPGAVHVPIDDLAGRLAELPRDRPVRLHRLTPVLHDAGDAIFVRVIGPIATDRRQRHGTQRHPFIGHARSLHPPLRLARKLLALYVSLYSPKCKIV